MQLTTATMKGKDDTYENCLRKLHVKARRIKVITKTAIKGHAKMKKLLDGVKTEWRKKSRFVVHVT